MTQITAPQSGKTAIAVTYIDHMGSDYSPIRAAVVSNGTTNHDKYQDAQGQPTEAARGLIKFLARGCTSGEWDRLLGSLQGDSSINAIEKTMNHLRHMPPHWTPFGHTAITLHIKAPLFVARQLQKHQVGFIWNELSRRYVDDTPEFYTPDVWRGRAADKKQGSEGAVDVSGFTFQFATIGKNTIPDAEGRFNHHALELYEDLLEHGVAPEQARMVLPQSMMTEWYWTANLYGWSKMFISRTDPHTQKETQDVAHMIGDIIRPLFPVSWAELVSNS